jgi:hypothetical protein
MRVAGALAPVIVDKHGIGLASTRLHTLDCKVRPMSQLQSGQCLSEGQANISSRAIETQLTFGVVSNGAIAHVRER